jgi:hypothetical protein
LEAGPLLRRFGAVAIVAFLVILCVYGFHVEPPGSSPELARIFPSWMDKAPVPAMACFKGLGNLSCRQIGSELEVSFLLGDQSASGWWYMTPVAFAVKTPLAELILFALALGIGLGQLRSVRLRELGFHWYLLVIPTVCYLVAAFISHSNVGERHLLLSIRFYFSSRPRYCCRNPCQTGESSRWRQRDFF